MNSIDYTKVAKILLAVNEGAFALCGDEIERQGDAAMRAAAKLCEREGAVQELSGLLLELLKCLSFGADVEPELHEATRLALVRVQEFTP